MNETVAKSVMAYLENAGIPSYLVGGAVRDKLLGLPVKDYDLATPATEAELLAVGAIPLPSRSGAPVYALHGIEIATFRKDSGERHSATFEPATMEEDALRRDFTVNALYEDINGQVFDPTGRGLKDLESKTLRFCGANDMGGAMDRIQEDPLRVLRGYRLAAQKRFSLSFGTFQAFKAQRTKELLKSVAQEQIGRELNKLLSIESGEDLALELKLMAEDEILAVIFPELDALRGCHQNKYHQEGDVFNHTLMVLENTPPDLNLRWAALLHDIGKPATQAVKVNKTAILR